MLAHLAAASGANYQLSVLHGDVVLIVFRLNNVITQKS